MPDKRITFNPIDTLDGFIAENIGSTSVEDPAWETLFSGTSEELPPGFYLVLYEVTMESDTFQKPAEARLLVNDQGSQIYHAVMAAVNEIESELMMYFITNPIVQDVDFEMQFRNGTGGGSGAILTVNRIEILLAMQAKRPIVTPFFTSTSGPIDPLGIQL